MPNLAQTELGARDAAEPTREVGARREAWPAVFSRLPGANASRGRQPVASFLLVLLFFSLSLASASSDTNTLHLNRHTLYHVKWFVGPYDRPTVGVALNEFCTRALEAFTSERVGEMVTVKVEGEVVFRATVQAVIDSGEMQFALPEDPSVRARVVAALVPVETNPDPPPGADPILWCFGPREP